MGCDVWSFSKIGAILNYYCPLNHKRVSPTPLKTEVGLTFCIGQAPPQQFSGSSSGDSDASMSMLLRSASG